MFRRFANAFDAARKAASVDERKAPSGLEAFEVENGVAAAPVRAAWALLHFGKEEGLEAAIESHQAFCRAKGYRCLVISDQIPAACFGGQVAFEFAPYPLRIGQAATGSFPAALDYCFRRLALIFTFWPVAGCHWHGTGSAELLALAPSDVHPLVRIALPRPPVGPV